MAQAHTKGNGHEPHANVSTLIRNHYLHPGIQYEVGNSAHNYANPAQRTGHYLT